MSDNKKLIIYPTLNTQPPQIPERSVFYSLEPIGVGTPMAESLVSYIARLASFHHVSPQTLIEEVNHQKCHTIHSIITTDRYALSDLIKELENLTKQSHLNSLTMLNWSNVINPLRLYKSVLS